MQEADAQEQGHAIDADETEGSAGAREIRDVSRERSGEQPDPGPQTEEQSDLLGR